MNNLTKDEMAIIEAAILQQTQRGNEILSYWHCKKCCAEKSPQRMSVGWTPKGIQVWCETHNENVQHIDLLGQQVNVYLQEETIKVASIWILIDF